MGTHKVGKHFQFMDDAQAVVPLTGEQAEAFESLSAICKETEALKARVAELEDENEWLKVCGNCGNHDDAVYSRCAVDGHAVPYSIACKFDPSRWTRRSTP